MHCTARLKNDQDGLRFEVSAARHSASLSIEPKPGGRGSSVSGGEMLMAALAACYCNDVYREAARMQIELSGVDVECAAEFPVEGAPAGEISYSVRIAGNAPESRLRELARVTDERAEIHNTVRAAIPVTLKGIDVPRA
jgi:uncharacterized OsmC-like protein